MLTLLLASALSWAAMTDTPPQGAETAVLLVCEDLEACAEAAWVVQAIEGYESLPMLLSDVILVDRLDGPSQGGDAHQERFAERLQAAQRELVAGRVAVARGALDDAEDVLGAWEGTPSNQELFVLHFLRGVVRLERGEDFGHELSFRQAAAVSWNRSVVLPEVGEAALEAWFTVLEDVVRGGVGRLHLERGMPGTVYALDGVPLGEGPVEITVFAGQHRLTANQPGTKMAWAGAVHVEAGRTRTTVARFPRVGTAAAVNLELSRSFDEGTLPLPLAEAMGDWGRRYGLQEMKLVRVGAVEDFVVAMLPTEERSQPGAEDVGEDGAEGVVEGQTRLVLPAGALLVGEHVVQELRFDPRSRRFVR